MNSDQYKAQELLFTKTVRDKLPEIVSSIRREFQIQENEIKIINLERSRDSLKDEIERLEQTNLFGLSQDKNLLRQDVIEKLAQVEDKLRQLKQNITRQQQEIQKINLEIETIMRLIDQLIITNEFTRTQSTKKIISKIMDLAQKAYDYKWTHIETPSELANWLKGSINETTSDDKLLNLVTAYMFLLYIKNRYPKEYANPIINQTYEEKYLKYKQKYLQLKNKKYNLYGGMDLNNFTNIYFKTYNTIEWPVGEKIYITSETNQELRDFCMSRHSTNELTKCTPPYEQTDDTLLPSNCCNYTNSKNVVNGISKRSIHKFNINSTVVSDDITFELVQEYDQIVCHPKDDHYKYINILINNKKETATAKQLKAYNDLLVEEADDDGKLNEPKEALDIFDTEGEYRSDEIFMASLRQREFAKSEEGRKLEGKIMQANKNKLFLQTINNNKTYYFYFSYGEIVGLEYINWYIQLAEYIKKIKELVSS